MAQEKKMVKNVFVIVIVFAGTLEIPDEVSFLFKEAWKEAYK